MVQSELIILINRSIMNNGNQTNQDFDQLKRLAIFAKVVELGSFAAAAKALKSNRSGVSEQVALLEKHLGTRLLHRTTRKLSLTTDGDSILPEANQIAQALHFVHEKLLSNEMSGLIRLTTTHDFAIHWLSPKIHAFNKQHPDVTFDLVLSDSTVDLVEQQIDLALRIGSPPNDSSLIARPLFRERLQIFGSPSFLSDCQHTDSLQAMTAMPWVLLKQLMNSKGMPLVSSSDNTSFDLKPSCAHRVDSPVVLIEQIKMGLGAGLLFPSIIKRDIDKGELVQILPEWGSEELLFYILYSTRRQMPLRVKTFLDFLLLANTTHQRYD